MRHNAKGAYLNNLSQHESKWAHSLFSRPQGAKRAVMGEHEGARQEGAPSY